MSCWPKVRKYRIKFKSSLKKWLNLREVKNDEGFLQYKISDHDMVSKTLPEDVFSSTITHMKISRKFMKILFFEILAFFQILLIFTYIFLTKLCTKKWLKQRLHRSMFKWISSSKDKILKNTFHNLFKLYHLWKNRFIWTYFCSIVV